MCCIKLKSCAQIIITSDVFYCLQLETPCLVHYTGRTIKGEIFDSSVERGPPISFMPNQVVVCVVPCFIKWMRIFFES